MAAKAVLWSTNNYTGPCGPKVSSGYGKINGFGHEEWNNAPNRIWHGQQVFHTETKPRLDSYAERGELGLLMTAMSGNHQVAVGIACGVRSNSEDEMTQIAAELKFASEIDRLWAVDTTRKALKTRAKLEAEWQSSMHWVRWRCPPELYHWFSEPVEIPPFAVKPDKKRLNKMHGNYQALRPEDALKLVGRALPDGHQIFEWLIDGDFDERFVSAADRKQRPQMTKHQRQAGYGAPAADAPYIRYLQSRKIIIEPRHRDLEARFQQFIGSIGGSDILPNQDCVDLRFRHPERGAVIAELKPAEPGETKYAIRLAIGQVLEYRHTLATDALPMIVLGASPTERERAFVGSLGIALAWPEQTSFTFEWPSAG